MFAINALRQAFLCCLFCAAAGATLSCEQEVSGPTTAPPLGMVWIEGTETDEGFFMDEAEVTVGQFQAFIEATDYVTEADDFGWSGVFIKDSLTWLPVTGATWEYPLGRGDFVFFSPTDPAPAAAPDIDEDPSRKAPANTPVTQVSLRDVKAYLGWAGKELPTEEEWMFAASQSGANKKFPWGKEMVPDNKYLGNWWQGPFPYEDEVLDGGPGIAPVKSYPPAANGLYDISGNVWEWTATTDARGMNVIKGGSFLCSTSYCTGFNLRNKQTTPADSGLNHLGFRGIIRQAK